jgi:Cation transporter/ATPase, N-terminus
VEAAVAIEIVPLQEGFTLSVQQLNRLAEVPPDEVFTSGIVSSAEDLAVALKTSLSTGIDPDKKVLTSHQSTILPQLDHFWPTGHCSSETATPTSCLAPTKTVCTLQDFAERGRLFGLNRLKQRAERGFFAFVKEALEDFTVLVLLAAGILSLVLGLALGDGGDGWIEGAAINVAVVVVVLVTAVNNYQKELQFRELNKLNEDVQVTSSWVQWIPCQARDWTYCIYKLVELMDTAVDITPIPGVEYLQPSFHVDAQGQHSEPGHSK